MISIFNVWWSALSTQSILGPYAKPDSRFQEVVHDGRALDQQLPELSPQSGTVDPDLQMSDTTKTGLTEFVDETEQMTNEKPSEIESSRYDTSVSGDSLDNFFTRPILLQSWLWQVGSQLDVLTSPWEQWITNKRVANRVANYANFKGKLHLKFVLNGNAFYWGRSFCSYTVYNQSPLITYEDSPLSIIPALQRPHIWLDASTSQGGELALPFFHQQDCLDIQNSTEFANMGKLWVKSMTPLRHANGSTRPISIQMFGWVEDISLSTLTQNTDTLAPQSGLVPQAGEVTEGGPISKPASALAKVASAVASAPVIRPYALATEAMASAVGATARLFGYSRPRIVEPARPMTVQQTGNLAATDMDETINTLALTSKQEISIDPRIVGLDGTDEMSFNYLASKWSYFVTFPWALSKTLNDPLFSIPVSPMAYQKGNRVLVPTTSDGWALTSLALVAMPFEYWRGTIKYRFQIVCSAYHKGRLLVTWEPRGSPSATPELNTVQSTIIDISETTDFEIEVGWGAKTPGLQVLELAGTSDRFAIGALATPDALRENGTINVYVLNDLVTSGSDTSDVSVLVSTASDDLEVWAPNQTHIQTMTTVDPPPLALRSLDPQSGAMGPVSSTVTFGSKALGRIPMICSGETITSFRTLMKRYILKRTRLYKGNLSDLSTVMIVQRGSSYLGDWFQEDFGMDIQFFIVNCFAGWRGSTRHRYVPAMKNGSDSLIYLQNYATRVSFGEKWGDTSIVFPDNSLPDLGTNFQNNLRFFEGGSISKTASTDVVEFEQPYYGFGRFGVTSHNLASKSYALAHQMVAQVTNRSGGSKPISWQVNHFTAGGEDFSLFGFLGVPPLWSY